jgi:cytochrome c oxidase cbb3-type subunit I
MNSATVAAAEPVPVSSPALIVETYNDKVVRQFTIMTVVWGIVGMLVGALIAAELIWPTLNFGLPWLAYGRLRFRRLRAHGHILLRSPTHVSCPPVQ